ncbi:MAG: hypothetical protein K2Q26_00805, partial [Bdellovibrionales bacterium]|nr:hypothetical protein [Bdellovibrionales bacterium]
MENRIPLPRHYKYFAFVALVLSAIAIVSSITISGSFYRSFWPSEMFGVHKGLPLLKDTPLFLEDAAGWDGQFYYLIANYPFSNSYPQYLDSAAYRTQRIGLPVTANLVSRFLFMEYVSPLVYSLTNIFVFLICALILISNFERWGQGFSVLLVPWLSSVGVTATLSHGLPDAFTSGILMVAILFYFKNKLYLYMAFATFAVLCREGTAFLFAGIALWEGLAMIRARSLIFRNIFTVSAPLVGLIFWQLYLYNLFGYFPSKQAHGMLAAPLEAVLKYFWSNTQSHKNLYTFHYLLIIGLAFFMGFKALMSQGNTKTRALGLGILIYTFLLSCLGHGVFMYHRDFLKGVLDLL